MMPVDEGKLQICRNHRSKDQTAVGKLYEIKIVMDQVKFPGLFKQAVGFPFLFLNCHW